MTVIRGYKRRGVGNDVMDEIDDLRVQLDCLDADFHKLSEHLCILDAMMTSLEIRLNAFGDQLKMFEEQTTSLAHAMAL